jgi:hypothetical protein
MVKLRVSIRRNLINRKSKIKKERFLWYYCDNNEQYECKSKIKYDSYCQKFLDPEISHSYLCIKNYQLIDYGIKIYIERKNFQKKIDSLEELISKAKIKTNELKKLKENLLNKIHEIQKEIKKCFDDFSKKPELLLYYLTDEKEKEINNLIQGCKEILKFQKETKRLLIEN